MRYYLLFCAVVFTIPFAHARSRDAASTMILFNRNDPDSQGLAQYYAKRRDIPLDQIIGLDCAPAEEVSRADYEQQIAVPLRALFHKRGWWTVGKSASGQERILASKIHFVAMMRGMPLKIAHDPTIPPLDSIPDLPDMVASRNDASVDSELTTLGMASPGPAGLFLNPYFRRFIRIQDDPACGGLLLIARLDAPTPSIVRAMIDDSLSAEKDGLEGWSYVDARGISSGGYAEGEQWLNALVKLMRTQGLPVIFDNLSSTFPAGYPITDAAIYFGWYADAINGPFADTSFEFRPGAVAVHLHSFSAATLRSTTANWCGPLLARGAAASLGNVYEPYLAFTHHLDVFQDRLMSGLTLAESGWTSQKALSWMGVVIGDPLYRPYLSWRDVKAIDPGNIWQSYRHILLKSSGDIFKAADSLRAAADIFGNSLFLEALGSAQLDARDWTGALASFGEAKKLAKTLPVQTRLDMESVQGMLACGKQSEAIALACAAGDRLPPGASRDLLVQLCAGASSLTQSATSIPPTPEMTPQPTIAPALEKTSPSPSTHFTPPPLPPLRP